MEQPTVVHSTFVIERHYPATPERVFAALADPAKKRRWFRGDGMANELFEMDFRVGGVEHSSFRITGGPPELEGSTATNDTTYLDIVVNQRVVMAYTMTVGEKRISASLATFDLLTDGEGTGLVFTEQAAFFCGADGPKMRQGGWGKLFDRLGRELAEGR